MVSFVDKPYVSDKVANKVSQIKWKTICGIGMVNIHFITLAENKNDLFDIYSATVFKQRNLRKSNIKILGIAADYADATLLVEKMIAECIDNDNVDGIRIYYEQYINRN